MATAQQTFIVKGLYNEWMKNCLDLIESSYGLNFQSESTSAHEITLNFVDSGTTANIATAGYEFYENDGKGFNLTLNVNNSKVEEIDTTDANGQIGNSASPFDVTIAHELTHSAMQANIAHFSELPNYFKEGSADITGGGDSSYSNIRLLLRNGAEVLKGVYAGSYDYSYIYAAGYMLLRYLAKQTNDNSGKNPVQVMKDLVSYLVANGGTSYDAAINSASDGLFANESALIESFTNAVSNATITSDDEADAFIKSVANINLGEWVKTNEQTITEGNTTRTTWTTVWDFGDSGAITGSDAGGGSYKNYDDIVPESTTPDSWNLPSTSYTYKGLTMIFPDEFLSTETVSTPTSYTYNGGDMTISDYQSTAQINIASDYTGINFDDNNFYVNSSSGSLTIENARDKVISYGDANGNLIAYSYLASGGGNIDGSGISQAEIIIGGNDSGNQILAGSGGSSLWGGNGGADTLVGGDGYDEFFFAMGSGVDVIQSASSNDVINLLGISLEQISGVEVNESAVSLSFSDGGNLRVEGNSGVGYKVGNEIYACNQSNQSWYTK